MPKVNSFVWVCIATVVTVALVAGLAKAASPSTSKLNGASAAGAKQLLESAKRFSMRAEQNKSPLEKLSNAHFGLAYISAARVLSTSDKELEDASGVRVNELHATLRLQQKTASDALGLSSKAV